MDAEVRMQRIDAEVSHVWMVRTFIKHAEETEEDDDLRNVHRDLYDFMLALGPSLDANDPAAYLKMAGKKMSKLRKATSLFLEVQPEVSEHTNFKMAARSLQLAVGSIEELLSDN